MKILFIIYDNGSYIHTFPHGIAYIAAVLKKKGHKVVIYSQDIHHYPEEHLTKYLDNNEFDIVGVSVIAGYYQYAKLLKLSKAINKSKRRNKFVYIIGGHGVSPDPEYFINKTGADLIVMGEGEATILDVVKRDCPADAKGIAYNDGLLGKTIINPRRELIQDIDSIPFPAYELFPMEYYRLIRKPHIEKTDFAMHMLSGRGCTFQCTFCYRMDEGFRPRRIDAIVDEIKLLKTDYGVNVIDFSDELLMTSEERTRKICEAIIKAKLNIKWQCNGTAWL